ncbi:hypothetical protein BJ085DRAFT_35814 [Dimargaris cristalligena]|uniref:RRM domain-containing protein n=1 Tax=Dimargaris cristalligena TaxID=215637 RepID=A0A4P9ZLZ3_9FUNG|nr:hypothetical protein BJ085DRAFT_35814 [Dimargaris cristalligena]|eukprot:RKP34128.1 hypothetical protein BJ085DRAFT_35814 [Dimargaris cristalligena]
MVSDYNSLLDQSLDDIVKSDSSTSRRPQRHTRNQPTRGGRTNQQGSGGGRRPMMSNGSNGASVPYMMRGAGLNTFQPPVMNPMMMGAGGAGILGGATNLRISNLHYRVTESDLRELFGQMGSLRSVKINHRSDGTSNGTALVVFHNPKAAYTAATTYNNVTLDGRTMRIEISQPVTTQPMVYPVPMAGQVRSPAARSGGPRRQGNQHSPSPYTRSQPRTNRPQPKKVDPASLDAEMDAYMAQDNE